MQLYLCEKPSQARYIARILNAGSKNNGYLYNDTVTVTWCFGILLALLTGQRPLIPGSAVVGAALIIQGGGRALARLKRGKPDSWLSQAILAWLERHHLRGSQLIQHSAVWIIRRSTR